MTKNPDPTQRKLTNNNSDKPDPSQKGCTVTQLRTMMNVKAIGVCRLYYNTPPMVLLLLTA